MQIRPSRITDSLGPLRAVAQLRLANLGAQVDRISLLRVLLSRKAYILELALVAGAYLIYVFTRGLIFSDVSSTGFDNAVRIISLEKSLGFFWEPGWQSWVLTNVKGLAAFLNWIYIFTYWPIIVVAGTVLYFGNRPKYYYYRSVVVINLVFALMIFMLFPVTSPFNITEYFVNTIQVLGPTFYGSPEMSSFYNSHAAMPSLHFSWTIILGVLFVRTFKGWFRVTGLLYPVLTFVAITITGNHFIMDAIAGGILAVAAFAVMELVFRGGFVRWRLNLIARWELLRLVGRQYRQDRRRLGGILPAKIRNRRTIYQERLHRFREKWSQGFKSPGLNRKVLARLRERIIQSATNRGGMYRDIWLRVRARLLVGLRRHIATR